MKDKNAVRRHLVVLYILFFSVVIISITAKIIPDARRGAQAAERLNTIFADSVSDNNESSFYFLNSIELEPYQSDGAILNKSSNKDESYITVTGYADRANLVIKEHLANGEVKNRSEMSVLGNSPLCYIASLVIAIGYIIMFVLIALIIKSVHTSIKQDKPVEKSNTDRVRFIGGIIIMGELITSLIQWKMNLDAAELLDHTLYRVNTHFSPDYIVIMIGILVLFMGELFSITHAIGEEQKYTI